MLWKVVFDNLLEAPEEVTGWPAKSILEQGRLYKEQDLVRAVTQRIAANRIHLLAGPEGRGKSTLASLVAFHLHRTQGKPTHAVISPQPGEEPEHIASAILARNRGSTALWVFEDCHATTDPLSLLKGAFIESNRTSFLFVARAVSPRLIDLPNSWPFTDIRKRGNFTFLVPTAKIVGGVIASYLHTQMPGRIPDSLDVDWALRTTGGDLRTLKALLDLWDPEKGPLRKLAIRRLYDSLIETKLKPLLPTPRLLETYAAVAAVYQFEVPVFGSAFPIDMVEELKNRGLVGTFGRNTYNFPHTSDARHTVEAYCRFMGKERNAFIASCIGQYLSCELPGRHRSRCLVGLRANSEFLGFEMTPQVRRETGGLLQVRGNALQAAHYVEYFCKSRPELHHWVKSMKLSGFRELIDRSDAGDMRFLLAAVGRIDKQVRKQLEGQISFEDKIGLVARSELSSLAKSLHYYQRTKNSSYFAKEVLSRALGANFREKVKRVSPRSAGRFLDVAHEIDVGLSEAAAVEIAEHLNLKGEVSAEEFSLLLTNIRFAENAWYRLVSRMLCETDPPALLRTSARGYSYILSSIADCVERRDVSVSSARVFFRAFVKGLDAEALREVGHKQVNWVIWSFLRVGEDPSAWITAYAATLVAFFSNADLNSTFWFYWNLLLAGDTLCRQLAAESSAKLLRRLVANGDGSRMSVIGLLREIGLNVEASDGIEANSLVADLSESNSPAKILFTLHGIRVVDLQRYEEVLQELRSHWQNVRQHIEELISQNSLQRARELLLAALNRLPEV